MDRIQRIRDLLEWLTELQLSSCEEFGYSEEEYLQELEDVLSELQKLGA